MLNSDLPVARQSENDFLSRQDSSHRLCKVYNESHRKTRGAALFFRLRQNHCLPRACKNDPRNFTGNFPGKFFDAGFSGVWGRLSATETPWVRPCWPFQGVGSLAGSGSRSRHGATSGVVGSLLPAEVIVWQKQSLRTSQKA